MNANKKKNKFLSLLLAMIMVLTMVPATAFAADDTNAAEEQSWTIFEADKRTKKPHAFAYVTKILMNSTAEKVESVDVSDPYNAVVYLKDTPKTVEDIPEINVTYDGAKADSLIVTNDVTLNEGEAVRSLVVKYNDRNITTWTLTYKNLCSGNEAGTHSWKEGEIVKAPTCGEGLRELVCEACSKTTLVPVDPDPTIEHKWVVTETIEYYFQEGQQFSVCETCGAEKEDAVPMINNPEFVEGIYYLDEEGNKCHLEYAKSESDTKVYDWLEFYNPIYRIDVPEGIELIYVEATDVWKPTTHYWAMSVDNEDKVGGDVYDDNGNSQRFWTVEENVITVPVESLMGGVFAGAVDSQNHSRIIYLGINSVHAWDEGTVTTEPTCTEDGVKTFKCTYEYCQDDEDAIKTEVIPATGHSWSEPVVKDATLKSDGKITKSCKCGASEKISTIPSVKSVKLSKSTYVYNKKTQKPSVVVKDRTGEALKSGTDYTVSYAKGRKNVGKYSVKVTFKGNYSGTKSLSFTIAPTGTKVTSLKTGKKKATVKWKKNTTQTTGYQIKYATNKNFNNSKSKLVKSNKTTKATISKLKSKKTYYVKVRTYKNVKFNGKTVKVYSKWSDAKKVKVK